MTNRCSWRGLMSSRCGCAGTLPGQMMFETGLPETQITTQQHTNREIGDREGSRDKQKTTDGHNGMVDRRRLPEHHRF